MEARAIICLAALTGLPLAPGDAARPDPAPKAAKPAEKPAEKVTARPVAGPPRWWPFDHGVARPKRAESQTPDAAVPAAPPRTARPPEGREAPRPAFAGVIYVEGTHIGRGNTPHSLVLADADVRVFGDTPFLTGRSLGADAKPTSRRIWVPLKDVSRIEEFDSVESMTQVMPARLRAAK